MRAETPFAFGYTEPIDQTEMKPIDGYYDPDTETWVSAMRGPGTTISTVPTYISPTVTVADNGRDD